MADLNKDITFDPREFVDSLIDEMGMGNEDPEKVSDLRRGIEFQMNDIILNTASIYIEPEVMGMVLNDYAKETDPTYIFAKLVENSPRAQLAILDALDDFYEQTVEAYKYLKMA